MPSRQTTARRTAILVESAARPAQAQHEQAVQLQYMSYSLNSLKWDYVGGYIGNIIGGILGFLDYGLHGNLAVV